MESLLVLIVLLAILGWVLGVIGFFRAGTARAELRDLRFRFDQLAAGRTQPVEPLPAPLEPEPIEPEAELPVAAAEAISRRPQR